VQTQNKGWRWLMSRRIAGLLEMMGQFLCTCVGAKGRTWWRKRMMRAIKMIRWPILTDFILRLHLYIYSGNLRYCFVPYCTPEWFDYRGRLEIVLRFMPHVWAKECCSFWLLKWFYVWKHLKFCTSFCL